MFTTPSSIRASAATVARLRGFRDEFGEDVSFRQAGYLWLFTDDESRATVTEVVEAQQKEGVASRVIDTAETSAIMPDLDLDGIVGAGWSQDDGYVDGRALASALGRAARRAGVAVVENDPVTSVSLSGSRFSSVTTRSGETFSAGILVNAAGTWAVTIAEMYGETLPLGSTQSQGYYLDRNLPYGGISPVVIDPSSGLHFHSEGRGLLAGIARIPEAPSRPWPVTAPEELIPVLTEQLVARVPGMAGARVRQSWAGLLDNTPDVIPIVGSTHADNIFTIAGFGGKGMCLALGLAPAAADLIAGRQPGLDLHSYRFARFAEGDLQPERGSYSKH